MKNNIYFYDNNQYFGALANTAPLKVNFVINGKLYNCPSSECIYQGLKGVLSIDNRQVAKGEYIMMGHSGNGGSVQKAGQQFNGTDVANNFHQLFLAQPQPLKELIMKDIVKAKLTQHPTLLKAVLEENGTLFVENSPYDDYWGIGRNQNGKNALGNIITEVAKELMIELNQTGFIKVCNSFSALTVNSINSAGNMIGLRLEPDSGLNINLFQYNTTPAYNLPDQINAYENQNLANSHTNHHYNSGYNSNIKTTDKLTIPKNLNMVELAKYLADNTSTYTKFNATSNKGSLITCEIFPKKLFVIKGTDNNGRPIEVKYDTINNKILEHGLVIANSNYGNWAKNIIEHQLLKTNNASSEPQFKCPGLTFNSMKELAHYLITNEPNCEFTAVSRTGHQLKCKITSGQDFNIQGFDRQGKLITVKYDHLLNVYENNNLCFNSGYGEWAKGIVEYGVNHPSDLIGLTVDY